LKKSERNKPSKNERIFSFSLKDLKCVNCAGLERDEDGELSCRFNVRHKDHVSEDTISCLMLYENPTAEFVAYKLVEGAFKNLGCEVVEDN